MNQNDFLERLNKEQGCMPSRFRNAEIEDIDLRGHEFEYPVYLNEARFIGRVDFSNCVFRKGVSFSGAIFSGGAQFCECQFEDGADFSLSEFRNEEADFFRSSFNGRAWFWRSRFEKSANFTEMKVNIDSDLLSTSERQANFSWTWFYDTVRFNHAKFRCPVYLWRTQFRADTFFDDCMFYEKVLFGGKQNEVLFPRYGLIHPERVELLESEGFFCADTEILVTERFFRSDRAIQKPTTPPRRLSMFLSYNNAFSTQHIEETLDKLNDILITQSEKNIITQEWLNGAGPMFADGNQVSFRNATFNDLESVSFCDIRWDNINVDTSIAGTQQQKFRKIMRGSSYDVFISHASDDKENIVRPLSEGLSRAGFSIWYDESVMEVGDELKETIDKGISESRFAVVVLSHDFFGKDVLVIISGDSDSLLSQDKSRHRGNQNQRQHK